MVRRAGLLGALLLAITAAALSASGTAAAGQRARAPTLAATVGPGYTISLTRDGKLVRSLKAGAYTLVVSDRAPVHAFSLDGPHGYARDFTSVPFVGTKTFTVKLVAGKYKYYCPPHEPTMFGRFTVTG